MISYLVSSLALSFLRINIEYPKSSLAQLVDYFSKSTANMPRGSAPCGKTQRGFSCMNLKDEKLSKKKGKNYYQHINVELNKKTRKTTAISYETSVGRYN